MKIRSHHESHIVELADGSRWNIFPADLDLTFHWKPDSEFRIELAKNEICSHELIDDADGYRVRVIQADKDWPIGEVKNTLKNE